MIFFYIRKLFCRQNGSVQCAESKSIEKSLVMLNGALWMRNKQNMPSSALEGFKRP